MLTDLKQVELDKAEEMVFNKFWGSTQPDKITSTILNMLGIDINDYIQAFENRVKPFMRDNGLIDGMKLKQVVSLKSPKLAETIPPHDFRLCDLVEGVISCL
jgi:hypothetical protein